MFWKRRQNKITLDGSFIIVVGATRSGKTTWVKNFLRRSRASVLILTTASAPWADVKELKSKKDLYYWSGGWARLTGLLFDKSFTPSKLLWKNNYVLVIDDAPALISSRSNLDWDRILLVHRNYGITIFYVTQSFRKVPKHILNTADIFVIGYLPNLYGEEKYLSDHYGRTVRLPEVSPRNFKILKARK